MSQQPVLFTMADGYGVITLNRADKLNAFNKQQHIELLAHLKQCAGDKNCRAVILTGAGRGFCAGQDLQERDFDSTDQPLDLGAGLEAHYNPLIRQIRSMAQPVICAVNGVAAGAGANIALSCDIVLAAKSANFIQSFVKIGLVPDAGGTSVLTKRLGEARAKALTLTAQPLGAQQAADWGLIWRAVDDDTLMEEAIKLALQLAHGPAHAQGLIKQAIHAASTNTFDEQLDVERNLQREAGHSSDYREGVMAFREKRAPRFNS